MEFLNRAWVKFVLAGVILAASPVLLASLQVEPGASLPPLVGWQVAGIVLGLGSIAAGMGILIVQTGLWGYASTIVFAVASVEIAQAVFPGKPLYQLAVFIALALVVAGSSTKAPRQRRASPLSK